jgi:hypothetical protein
LEGGVSGCGVGWVANSKNRQPAGKVHLLLAVQQAFSSFLPVPTTQHQTHTSSYTASLTNPCIALTCVHTHTSHTSHPWCPPLQAQLLPQQPSHSRRHPAGPPKAQGVQGRPQLCVRGVFSRPDTGCTAAAAAGGLECRQLSAVCSSSTARGGGCCRRGCLLCV